MNPDPASDGTCLGALLLTVAFGLSFICMLIAFVNWIG